ncbi:hypothetical protein EVA_02957 [gut metagenome]|uniref:Uncharacterized protein n=1 Tax=gut metagenome TaxID=749906 RepID=J9H007_9ZZZZ
MGQIFAFEGEGRVESVAVGKLAVADESERSTLAEGGEQTLRLTEGELLAQGGELAHEIYAVGGEEFGNSDVQAHEGIEMELGGFLTFPLRYFVL